jgi:catalase
MVAMSDNTAEDMARPTSANDSKAWTDNQGHPVESNMHSMTVGSRGPVLLEDYHLLEKLAQFHRERIPERVVHARGMSAKGVFEVTHDVTDLTFADFLSEVGKKTQLTARFSTVVHERGSPETMRDVRGFSVKMYTDEGNWDFVGNDIPVFFIRDGIKFVDLVHSLKPSPRKHVQEGWRVLDFLSHHPESCNILTYLLSDEGIPADYRHMNGFGVHTFKLLTKEGKETYIKWHWISKQGEKYMTNEEADGKGSGPKKPVTATLDLYEAIEEGNFPEWQLCIQTMDPEQEGSLDFDPLDSTKIWPEEQFPLRPVGKMVLDRNVDNWYTDNEMVAFSPGVAPPGLAPSDDKLLQSRIMSYSDAQRYRLGANYLTLPINQPKNTYHNNHYDGLMNTVKRTEEIDYFPSRNNQTVDHANRGPLYSHKPVSGEPEKEMIHKENNFQQAGDRIRAYSPESKKNFMENLEMWMTEPKTTDEVRGIWYDYWSQCDSSFGAELKSMVEESLKQM